MSFDPEVGLFLAVALLALGGLAVLTAVGAVVRWVVPLVVANAVWIGLALAAAVALVLVDWCTRPWFVEAESARLFHAPRRIWRVRGWWRSRRVIGAVVAAIADGRIDSEHGVVVFSDRARRSR